MILYFSAGSRRPLKQSVVPLVGLKTCRRSDWLGNEFVLTDRMICAGEEMGGVDTCQVKLYKNGYNLKRILP